MIVIVDYGMGNIGSIVNMLKKCGSQCIVSSTADDIDNADRLILPGVGAFDTAIQNLNKIGLLPVLEKKVFGQKTPILGICLGMQIFAQNSEEGQLEGLGWIKGRVKRFSLGGLENKNKIPHMGWNEVFIKKNHFLFEGLYEKARFYFVHSYHFVCESEGDILAQTLYGYEFVSAIQKDNILGVQFHPEKSHRFGLKLLYNFTRL